MQKSSITSPLARARGLGSAHEGTHHWWWQRLTAVALIPLSVWFLYALFSHLMMADMKTTLDWFKSPFIAFTMLITVLAMCHHAKLGMQVILEDYLHCECVKITALIINKLLFIGLMVLSALAIFKLHLG